MVQLSHLGIAEKVSDSDHVNFKYVVLLGNFIDLGETSFIVLQTGKCISHLNVVSCGGLKLCRFWTRFYKAGRNSHLSDPGNNGYL